MTDITHNVSHPVVINWVHFYAMKVPKDNFRFYTHDLGKWYDYVEGRNEMFPSTITCQLMYIKYNSVFYQWDSNDMHYDLVE